MLRTYLAEIVFLMVAGELLRPAKVTIIQSEINNLIKCESFGLNDLNGSNLYNGF